eukprot:gene10409-11497_t
MRKFVCLADKEQADAPDCEEHRQILMAGLGEMKLSLPEEAEESDIRQGKVYIRPIQENLPLVSLQKESKLESNAQREMCNNCMELIQLHKLRQHYLNCKAKVPSFSNKGTDKVYPMFNPVIMMDVEELNAIGRVLLHDYILCGNLPFYINYGVLYWIRTGQEMSGELMLGQFTQGLDEGDKSLINTALTEAILTKYQNTPCNYSWEV